LYTPPVHQELGHPLRLEATDSIRLQERAQDPLDRDRMRPHELAVGVGHAAEVLGPGAVHQAVDHHLPHLPGAQLLGLRGKGQDGIDLAFGQQPGRLIEGVSYPVNVLARVHADVGRHAGQKDVLGAAQTIVDVDGLPLQIPDGAHPFAPEQLEAANMDPGEDHERVSGVHAGDQGTGEVHTNIDLPGHHILDGQIILCRDVLYIGESLGR
jgi:hypothetical protein